MSKAFTSEETEDAGPLVRPAPKLRPGEVRYVTKEGHAAMVAEKSRLEEERAALRASAAVDAKAKRAEVDAKLSAVTELLAVLTVPDPPQAGEARIFFGATVTLESEEGEERTFRLVGPDEADVKRGLLSVESPLAQALLGKGEGDVVEWRKPSGDEEWTVERVEYR